MNQFKTAVLLAALMGLFIVIGHLIGGTNGAMVAFGIALVMNFAAYWWSDKIVLAMYRAREVDPSDGRQLYQMVERCARNAGLPTPRVYIVPTDMPNAFATGRDPHHAAVAVTEGLLRTLAPDEAEGVIAHEVSHIKNRDTLISTVAATIAGAISMLAYMARFAAFFGGSRGDDDEGSNPMALLLIAIVAPIAALIIQMAVSRSREYLADATGAQICGRPMSLANALRKLDAGVQHSRAEAQPATAHLFIVNPLRGGGLMTLFSTHPPMEERIARLEAMAGTGV
ncbi:MAG: zinc metalloprotease HtpX [Armatimonadetes bacterium]|nr:zinc metalloprotease HtpX [Armatimonadota bacterium]